MLPPQPASLPPTGQTGELALPAPVARSSNAITALIHLYRAEVGRLTAYRARLDTTTNWAITTSALVATFAFNNEQISHIPLLVVMLVNYFFLHVEARRFRAYEATRYRVQLLERCFYPELLGEPVRADWPRQLVDALRSPGLTVDLWGALGWRLRRTYLAIHAAVLVAWLGKLFLSAGGTLDINVLLTKAAIAVIPGWLVGAVVALFSLWLVVLAVGAQRNKSLGDEEAHVGAPPAW